MHVLVKTAATDSEVRIEVNEELKLSSLIVIALLNLRMDALPRDVIVWKGKSFFRPSDEITLKELNICDGDVLTLSIAGNKIGERATNLLRSIHVSKNRKRCLYEVTLARHAKMLYDNMSKKKNRATVAKHFPQLVDKYISYPQDLGLFIMAFQDHFLRKKVRDMRREKLDLQLDRAVFVFPECFTKTALLYVEAKLNGFAVTALVDTGAQASIISYETVRRCNMLEYVDSRFCILASGVGGAQSSLGRILACDLLVNNLKLICSFDVLPDDVCDIGVIIGLDVLSKNQAVLNVADRTIRFGNLGSASFIPVKQAAKIKPFKESNTDGGKDN